jgi:fatty acid CoA ligase FadD9
MTTRLKPFAYVSTVGVGATMAPGEFTEDADIRSANPARTVDDNYANGYATSKWAGEVLLRQAHDLCGLPVSVFRCDMIMAETTYRGQLNLPDMVTRMVLSIAVTGLAPGSFYQHEVNRQPVRAHFDGLPVDFVADAISTLAMKTFDEARGFQTYHVMNPHDDGIGLDQFVDWMAQAGCHIERIADYEQWRARFESALRNLPERQRQASLLPLLVSFRYPQPALSGAFAPTQRFESAVAHFGIGDGGEIPHIDRSVIKKYLFDLELMGLLDPSHRTPPSVEDR